MIILTGVGRYDTAIIGEGSQLLSFDDTTFKYFPSSASLEFYDGAADSWNSHTSLHLSQGTYRLYDVRDELNLHETLHLELEDEGGFLTCYLIPNGFPTVHRKRVRYIATPQHAGDNDSVIVQFRLLERGGL
ncbi:hypothetical protein CMN23_03470 [Candidatus Saccharibacteria bacterium]|nr:hypothetical protein [Candidatus Saccharibacteria bacterium]